MRHIELEWKQENGVWKSTMPDETDLVKIKLEIQHSLKGSYLIWVNGTAMWVEDDLDLAKAKCDEICADIITRRIHSARKIVDYYS